jgi:hypothetical protein
MTSALKLVADVQLSIEGTPLGDREKLQKILHPAYQSVSQAASNWNNSSEAISYLEQSVPVIKEAVVFLCTNDCPDEIAFPRLLTLSQSLKAIATALSAYWSDDKSVDDALAAIASANKYLSKSL